MEKSMFSDRVRIVRWVSTTLLGIALVIVAGCHGHHDGHYEHHGNHGGHHGRHHGGHHGGHHGHY